ncbi:MAG: BolA/IbaG family iron-sulfur metabolism protein [Proteobacteria bacterium]|jgi:acid stress-induced BolA-like protein IbaG/YrbA|nr:BolA/IbaG family iron-sulfur metabolism protein [Pseudomonadota bacterium]
MDCSEIEAILAGALVAPRIAVSAEGNKIALDLTSESFEGLSRVKRQQLVYGLLKSRIESGEIHAVTMRTRTPSESEAG